MHNSKTLVELVRQAKDLDEVCRALDVLATKTSEKIESGPLALESARAMALDVARIRSLLQELERAKADACKAERDLAGKYADLEGKIKEIRNDLDRRAK